MNKEEEIRKLAYKIYLKKDCKKEEGLANWLKAEKIILCKDRFFRLLRHPLVLILISGIGIWGFQQEYLKKQEMVKIRLEIMSKISPLYASYYQEIWNHWYAFNNNQPSEQYRRNIQRIVVESKTIETQLPILFKDKKIYEGWENFLHIFWEANYPIFRQGIPEEDLNKKLNSAATLIDDILNRMYNELK